MNTYQNLWWTQSVCDHTAFKRMRGEGFAQCHLLQFLQMSTEKIAKAYFWRTGAPPQKSHTGFVKFLRFLGQTRQADRDRVAVMFGFVRFSDFQRTIRSVLPLAYELERITPDLANNGANPEYPWPHAAPQFAPATFTFAAWERMCSGNGRQLMRLIESAVERFPEYSDI
jgi:hypothetical protein